MSIQLVKLAPLLALALVACGQNQSAGPNAGDDDPALTGALADQIMIDPDLAGQNRGNAALSGGGPANGELPAPDRSPEAAAAALADAVKLAGGSLQAAPAPGTGPATSPANDVVTAAAMAQILPGAGANCADKVNYTAAWAAKLPAALAIYPRGAVQEAAGTDQDGCQLRVVNFVTPVGVKDVIDYYYTRSRRAGYAVSYRMEGTDHVLGGSKQAAGFVIYVRKLADGQSEVDLAANGS